MKTKKMIEKKHSKLINKFNTERANPSKVRGNMRDKYITSFESFVGDIYDYSYPDRLDILKLKENLFDVTGG